MFTPPAESPRCRTVGKENGRNGSSGNRRKGFRRPVPAACLFGEGGLGQRMPWRAVTSMRRRFMSSMVQPMPVRATAARSMPFVFAPVDAMT